MCFPASNFLSEFGEQSYKNKIRAIIVYREVIKFSLAPPITISQLCIVSCLYVT